MRREGALTVVRDDLRRGRVGLRRAAWRAIHDCSPNATPIYILGVQRSGTNMLLGAFAKAPETEIHNESMNSRAFSVWTLRGDDVVRSLIESSRHRCIIFKPLVDIYRVVHLMEGLGVPSSGRAIWIYRDFADRVRSVYGNWPDSPGEYGLRIATGYRNWETAGLTEETLSIIDRLDAETMTPASGAALFWYLRNSLFFDLQLAPRPDVALISYDTFIVDPAPLMAQLCDFAGVRFRSEMVSGIARRPPPVSIEIEIDPVIADACDVLRRRLDDEFARRLEAGSLVGGTAEHRRVPSPPTASGAAPAPR